MRASNGRRASFIAGGASLVAFAVWSWLGAPERAAREHAAPPTEKERRWEARPVTAPEPPLARASERAERDAGSSPRVSELPSRELTANELPPDALIDEPAPPVPTPHDVATFSEAEPSEAEPSQPPSHEPPPHEPASEDEPSPAPPVRRRLESVAFSRWQQAGMCNSVGEALEARQTMMTRFRRAEWQGDVRLYLDPRLTEWAHVDLREALDAAEREVTTQLSLRPAPPNVFAYRDPQLLLAGACTNDDVVAYYDGDLHVVATDADVAQSLTHEYAHHALMTAGIIGPTWAQEGIAMLVARETWWRQERWLERVAERPFSLETMENAVPYTLSSEQATLFYVQAAAMVACAVLDEPTGLLSLVQALAPGADGQLEYALPPRSAPAALRACARELQSRRP